MVDPSIPTLDEAQETLLRAAITNTDQPCFNACKVLFDELARLSTPPKPRSGDFQRGVRTCIEWLHQRAREMNDPHAKAVLNSAAFSLGVARVPNRLEGEEWVDGEWIKQGSKEEVMQPPLDTEDRRTIRLRQIFR